VRLLHRLLLVVAPLLAPQRGAAQRAAADARRRGRGGVVRRGRAVGKHLAARRRRRVRGFQGRAGGPGGGDFFNATMNLKMQEFVSHLNLTLSSLS
jgi:hypothetical protein